MNLDFFFNFNFLTLQTRFLQSILYSYSNIYPWKCIVVMFFSSQQRSNIAYSNGWILFSQDIEFKQILFTYYPNSRDIIWRTFIFESIWKHDRKTFQNRLMTKSLKVLDIIVTWYRYDVNMCLSFVIRFLGYVMLWLK